MLLLAFALSLAASDPSIDLTPTQHRLRVLVSIDLRTANNGVHVSEVMDDVRAIWKPYLDLEFDGQEVVSSTTYDDQVRVAIVDHPMPGSSLDGASLGWIDFRAPGKPSNTVTVSTAVITRLLADGRWGGRPIQDFPASFRARLVKQALARSIAHELGHYLLRSSAHASDGLMRPRLTVFDMIVPGTNSFRLLPDQIKMLERRTATGVLAEVPSSSPAEPAARASPGRDHKS
jgi:hypothetical protein